MVSKGDMWVFSQDCGTQSPQELSYLRIQLDHTGSWVQIPSGARIFPSFHLILYYISITYLKHIHLGGLSQTAE